MKIFSRLKIGILCICMIVLNLSSMTLVEVPTVSATTFPSSEDFESWDGGNNVPNPVDIRDWTLSLVKEDDLPDESAYNIYMDTNGDFGFDMQGGIGRATKLVIKSNKGPFKINKLTLQSGIENFNSWQIEGYRNNGFIEGAKKTINIAYPALEDIVFTESEWQNIDELRISRVDKISEVWIGIYNIDVDQPITGSVDSIPPTLIDGSITTTNLSSKSVTLNWLTATDNITSTEDLEYQVYQSISNNIDTVNNIETNGIALGNYSKNTVTRDISGLLPNVNYYFNVIVKDAAGNKTAYTMVNVTTLNEYSVSFNVDGGSTVAAQTVAHGKKATEPLSAPTKANYTFGGWYTSSAMDTPFNFNNAITGDTIVYAKWNPVTYTVSFNVDGGSAVASQTIAHGEKATEPVSPPTKANHTFGGWYTSSAVDTPFNFNNAITGDTIVYAKWNPVTYTVSFNVDGGSAVTPQAIAHGGKATEPVSPPTKANHAFGGWYTSSAMDTPFNFNNAITGDTVVYAKWNPVTYTVSFNVDGGSTVTSKTIAHGEKATEPTSAPTKANHTFGGWYTSSAMDTPFNFNNAITGDIVVYAKWNPVKYTVSFGVAGGSAVSNQTVDHGGKASHPTPAPTKAGYTFDGWYTSNAYTTPFDFDSVITVDTTIYAKWNPVTVTHTVSFDVAGGSTVSNQTIDHGKKASQPTPAPTKAGYAFDGWYTSNAYTTPSDFDSVITADTTIYAKWNPVTVMHTVSFDVAGGSTVSNQTIDHGEKASQPTPAPTKARHTFDGWYTSNAYTTPFD
ncbi:InlB B-repeat-containing protein, partial [Lysinibacillus sp. NPDC047702]|uniref:InlB B-repeat-containing protein n=1 Tax=unclassified Lysinibacillus TaxID=2636778 RepID=UPI003D0933C3